MADVKRTQLELLYTTSAGKSVTFAILDPKDGVTAEQANTVAQTILSKNIFTYSGSALATFEKAQLRVLNVTALA